MDYPRQTNGGGNSPLEVRHEKEALSRTLSCLGLGLLLFLLTARGVSLLVGLLRQRGILQAAALTPIALQLLNLIAYILSLLVPILAVPALLGRPVRSMVPLAVPHPRFFLPAMGLTLGVAAGINLLSSLLLYYIQQHFGVALPAYAPQFFGGWASFLLTVRSSAVFPAVLEEALFRGLVLHSLRPFGDGFAVAVSAVLFALCHTTVGQWLPAFIIGLCLGCFVVRSGSVLTGMIIHFVYNLMVTLVSMGGYFGGEEHQMLGTLLMVGLSLVACLVSYIVLSERYGSIFRLRDRGGPLSGGQRLGAVFTNIPVLMAAAMLLYTTLSPVVGGAIP